MDRHGDELPAELRRRESRLQKIGEAKAALEQAAKEQAERKREEVKQKLAERKIGFVLRFVFRYYLHYNESAFTDPFRGAANYWKMRGWLLIHITSGMLAILIGPWQFSWRLRQWYLQLHRVAGRVYVIALLCGCAAALRLAPETTFGKAWGFGLFGLAFAWATTTFMAYYAVRQRQISIHKEWMVRSYVVTFAFVVYRAFNDYPPMMNWIPKADRSNVYVWATWAIPLLIAEVILQLVRMRRETPGDVPAR